MWVLHRDKMGLFGITCGLKNGHIGICGDDYPNNGCKGLGFGGVKLWRVLGFGGTRIWGN